ncbi:hypothetical protein COLO4_20790 [Corchorus olitorius]|uniref:Uncharacterized protein n=1 Tax=Corchorus olitorius TaxID=93759 RepID=A0A1R3IWX6_9ROSI|nr:hypothetical protein COLO4_20790 [Corchorus olitorius]
MLKAEKVSDFMHRDRFQVDLIGMGSPGSVLQYSSASYIVQLPTLLVD